MLEQEEVIFLDPPPVSPGTAESSLQDPGPPGSPQPRAPQGPPSPGAEKISLAWPGTAWGGLGWKMAPGALTPYSRSARANVCSFINYHLLAISLYQNELKFFI